MLGRKFVINDYLSPYQSSKLKASLYSFFNEHKPLGTSVPPGYHFAYYNPQTFEGELSKDGYDSYQQPQDDTFRRRRWVGGQMDFIKPLELGKESQCNETITRFRRLKDNFFVDISREMVQDGEIRFKELRQLIYTNHTFDPANSVTKIASERPTHTHQLTPTEILLFRYSALTFNPHKIHYNKEYSQREGYPDLLVHGPLMVTLLLEWATSMYAGLKVQSFKYKNSSPAFVNQPLRLCQSGSDAQMKLWIENSQGFIVTEGLLTSS